MLFRTKSDVILTWPVYYLLHEDSKLKHFRRQAKLAQKPGIKNPVLKIQT